MNENYSYTVSLKRLQSNDYAYFNVYLQRHNTYAHAGYYSMSMILKRRSRVWSALPVALHCMFVNLDDN